MKDVLLTRSVGRAFSDDQEQLIDVLSNTSFVRVGRSYSKIGELKSPKTHVFKLMCTEESFPPKEYDIGIWHDFFILLGMQDNINGAQYLQFAKKIESEGRLSGVTDQLQEKSSALIESLMVTLAEGFMKKENDTVEKLSPETLHKLSQIHFIVPAHVEERYSELFGQYDRTSSLICFDGSVPFQYGKDVWTTVPLLPYVASFQNSYQKWFCEHLNIMPLPTDEQVIRHCKNIGTAIKGKLKDITVHEQQVT